MSVDAQSTVFRPRLSHWMPLLIPMAFPIGLGVAGVWQGDTLLGLLAIAFGVAIIAYNGSTRLRIGSEISFSRFGRTLWSVGSRGVSVRSGRCGEIPVLPAFTLTDTAGATGSFPKSMLAPSELVRFKHLVANLDGLWLA
jgi:hypothetical protein